MAWTRLDDQFFANPKVIDLSKDAKLLYLSAVTYAAGQLTDGRISPGALRVVAALVDADRRCADELVAAGLWEQDGNDVLIHDYLEYNPTAADVRARRAADRERKRPTTIEGVAEDSARNPSGVAGDSKPPVPTPVPIVRPEPDEEIAADASPRSRSPDEIFEALCEVCYGKPHSAISKRERGKLNTARSELAGLEDVTPAEVLRRGQHYAVMWPDLGEPSPTAISGNWTKLGNDIAKRNGRASHAADREDPELVKQRRIERAQAAGVWPHGDESAGRRARDAP